MIDFNELFHREEPLCEELMDHVTDGPLGKMIHHPLYISLTYHENYCAIINESFRQKKLALEEAYNNNNYFSAIMLHERPYRFDALVEVIDGYGLEHEECFWNLVGHVWIDSENIYQNFGGWRRIWSSEVEGRETAMTDEERDFLAGLAETFTVYRGVQQGGTKLGMSWTLDKEKAKWFANRYNGSGCVLEGIANKNDVLAYFAGRGESEVVIFPQKVAIV